MEGGKFFAELFESVGALFGGEEEIIGAGDGVQFLAILGIGGEEEAKSGVPVLVLVEEEGGEVIEGADAIVNFCDLGGILSEEIFHFLMAVVLEEDLFEDGEGAFGVGAQVEGVGGVHFGEVEIVEVLQGNFRHGEEIVACFEGVCGLFGEGVELSQEVIPLVADGEGEELIAGLAVGWFNFFVVERADDAGKFGEFFAKESGEFELGELVGALSAEFGEEFKDFAGDAF